VYSPTLQKTARTSGQYEKVLHDLTKCVFCDLRAKYIIDEEDGVILSANLFPYTNAQLIIIPRRHVEKMSEMTVPEWSAVKKLTEKALRLLKNVYDIRDVNVIYREGERAGKSLRHAHINIIPFTADLMTWNYQEITEEPIEVAKRLKNI